MDCIAIDLKSFYASVECVERGLNPLTARLVVADERRTDKTICLAVTPALKAYGIPGRARLFEVKQRLEEIRRQTGETIDFVIAPPHMSLYMRRSAQIYGIYLRYVSAEDIHVYSVDEVLMDVTAYLPLYGLTARELAMRMIRDVLAETGITATAGIGTNLYLCKVAMDILAKRAAPDKDGVRIAELDEEGYREQLWDHRPIRDFWRIGRGLSERLRQHGMETMGDIARRSLTDEESLYRLFGIDAELLIDHAWGLESCTMVDIKAFKPERESLSVGQVLAEPYPFDKARIIVREMTEQLTLEMAGKGLAAGGLSLDVIYDTENLSAGYAGAVVQDFYGRAAPKPAHGTARFPSPTASGKAIMAAMMAAFDRQVSPKLTVRRVYIALTGLKDAGEARQLSFFDDPGAEEREQSLQQTVLGIRGRFGANALFRAASLSEGATGLERNAQVGGHQA
ncbi:MAG: DNA methylase [Clostridia bacterium]|nr:DNA methylase [Clostridia bacterium]